MNLNFLGKITYIFDIVRFHKEWYRVFLSRVINIHIKSLRLRNGIVITGGQRSIIQDLIYDIFIKKVYNPQHMEINDGDVVMDIGANIGVFSLFAFKNGAKKIYSIEPLGLNIITIKKNFHINKFEQPKIVKVAVSSNNGYGKLYLNDLDSHGQLINKGNTKVSNGYVKVKTMSLSHLLDVYRIRKINFLKIDCEGSEGEIFQDFNKKLSNQIDRIALEYHDGISSHSHSKIAAILVKCGYRVNIQPTSDLFGYIYATKPKSLK